MGMMQGYETKASDASSTGIFAQEQYSLGTVRFRIGLKGIHECWYTADVIGGESSWCPGLIPLHTMRAFHAVLICNHYTNGDGVLALWHNEAYKPQRLYLTDSGHYILRIDQYGQGDWQGTPRVRQMVEEAVDWFGNSYSGSSQSVELLQREAQSSLGSAGGGSGQGQSSLGSGGTGLAQSSLGSGTGSSNVTIK